MQQQESLIKLKEILNIPVEKMVMKYYKFKAVSKLKSMTNLKVIGITGRFGKTSKSYEFWC